MKKLKINLKSTFILLTLLMMGWMIGHQALYLKSVDPLEHKITKKTNQTLKILLKSKKYMLFVNIKRSEIQKNTKIKQTFSALWDDMKGIRDIYGCIFFLKFVKCFFCMRFQLIYKGSNCFILDRIHSFLSLKHKLNLIRKCELLF